MNTANVIFVSDLHLIGIWAICHIERIDLFDQSTSICLSVVSARVNGRVAAALWTRLAVLMRLHTVWGETQRRRWRWWREGEWRAGILLLIRSSICDGGDPEPKRIQVGPISPATTNANWARWLLTEEAMNQIPFKSLSFYSCLFFVQERIWQEQRAVFLLNSHELLFNSAQSL